MSTDPIDKYLSRGHVTAEQVDYWQSNRVWQRLFEVAVAREAADPTEWAYDTLDRWHATTDAHVVRWDAGERRWVWSMHDEVQGDTHTLLEAVLGTMENAYEIVIER